MLLSEGCHGNECKSETQHITLLPEYEGKVGKIEFRDTGTISCCQNLLLYLSCSWISKDDESAEFGLVFCHLKPELQHMIQLRFFFQILLRSVP